MIELRFIERVQRDGDRAGSVLRVLQCRHGNMYPWYDVPTYTLEQQRLEEQERARDAIVVDYGDR